MQKERKNHTVPGVNEKNAEKGVLRALAADLKVFGNLRVLCLSAMLCAMSYILGYFAKMIFGLGPVRFTLENLPIIFGGVSFGPFAGALIAAAADLCSCLASAQGPNPLILVGSISVGLVSGTVGRYICKSRRFLALLIVEFVTHLIGSLIIKSAALHIFYGYALVLLLPRIPIYAIIIGVESYVLWLLFRNRQIRTLLERIRK